MSEPQQVASKASSSEKEEEDNVNATNAAAEPPNDDDKDVERAESNANDDMNLEVVKTQSSASRSQYEDTHEEQEEEAEAKGLQQQQQQSTNDSDLTKSNSMDKDAEDTDVELLKDEMSSAMYNGAATEPVKQQNTSKLPDNADNVPLLADDELDENNAPVHMVINEWAQGTSIHGVAEISNFAVWKMWKRVLWSVLVIASGAVMIWQITTLVKEYKAYEVVTETETLIPSTLTFPEITFCNLDTYSAPDMDLFNLTHPRTPSELEVISHTRSNFILFGDFQGEDLDVSYHSPYFRSVITPFGLCHALHIPNATITKPGIFGGLEIFFDLRQQDYSNLTEMVGLLVWAQQPGTYINEEVPFVTAGPGHNTIVRLHQTEFVREKELPWSTCHSQAPEYTRPLCRAECINSQIRKTCNCSDIGDSLAPPDMLYCEPQDDLCVYKVYAEDAALQQACGCEAPPCHEIQYDISVSTIDFTETFEQFFEKFLGNGDPNTTRDDFVHNFVAVNINFDSLQTTRLTESKAVTFAQLLGSIGGSMGLFLGISALSVIEVLGDCTLLRLVPRFFGYKHLYGLGAIHHPRN